MNSNIDYFSNQLEEKLTHKEKEQLKQQNVEAEAFTKQREQEKSK